MTLEVSGETFAAHHCVLAARCTVFMAQLFGPMMEGTTSSVIQIKDMEAEVFAALLSFIYTDSFPEMEEEFCMEKDETWTQNLLVAADKYDLQRLKFICERQLSENIGVSSVASNLRLLQNEALVRFWTISCCKSKTTSPHMGVHNLRCVISHHIKAFPV